MQTFTPIESQELSRVEKLEQRPFWKRLLLSYRDLLRLYGELQSMYEESKFEMSKKQYITKEEHLKKMNNLNEVIQKQAERNRILTQEKDGLSERLFQCNLVESYQFKQ
jgi:tRNA(Ser,Leu) C12 N-acetylase TAN1